MKNEIIPKKENAGKGFHYTVTDEQIAEYAKWTIEEKMNWIVSTAGFINKVQTPEERKLSRQIKGKE